MRLIKHSLILHSLGWALMVPGMAGAESFLSWTTGIDYSSGGYGSDMTTETWYLPLTARWNAADWQFKLTLPYVRMKAPSGGVIIGYDDNGLPIRDGVGTPVTQDGLGDMVASATYSLLEHPDLMLDLTAKLKLGTASVSKGLGTGEHDYGLVLDAYVPLGKATPFFSLGYKRPGDPAGQNLRNTWQTGAGLAYKVSNTFSAGGMYDWRSAASLQGEPQRDLTFYAVFKISPSWKAQGYASKGFSDASSDYGTGLMVSQSF